MPRQIDDEDAVRSSERWENRHPREAVTERTVDQKDRRAGAKFQNLRLAV